MSEWKNIKNSIPGEDCRVLGVVSHAHYEDGGVVVMDRVEILHFEHERGIFLFDYGMGSSEEEPTYWAFMPEPPNV